jgi:uncharacterized membrane protein YdbT with pleckstrin-like domain
MDEKTLFSAHPAMFKYKPISFSFCSLFMLSGLVLPFFMSEYFSWIVGGILFASGILCLFAWWINTLFVTLTITEKRTILQKGFFSRHTREVFHSNIRNIEIEQTLMERIFNVGTMRLASAAHSEFEIAISGIKNPMALRDLINKYRRNDKTNDGMSENTQSDD